MPGAELHDAGAGDAGAARARSRRSSRCSPTTATTNSRSPSNGVTANGRSVRAAPTVDVVEYYNAVARPLLHHLDRRRDREPRRRLDADALDAHRPHVPGVRRRRSRRRARCAASTSRRRSATRTSSGAARPSARRRSSAQPGLVLEDPDYMHVVLPTAGTCPGGTQPVYRLFNNRAGRESPLHDRPRGARPDGGAGLDRGRRRGGRGRDVRAGVTASTRRAACANARCDAIAPVGGSVGIVRGSLRDQLCSPLPDVPLEFRAMQDRRRDLLDRLRRRIEHRDASRASSALRPRALR